MASFDADKANVSITFTKYVANIILQIILGNGIRNDQYFETLPSGVLLIRQACSLNLNQFAYIASCFMFLLVLRSNSSLVNLFCWSVSSWPNPKPDLQAILYQVSWMILTSESFLSSKNISYNNKNFNYTTNNDKNSAYVWPLPPLTKQFSHIPKAQGPY